MIVVIEGIDRVGKTTLCDKLKEIGCKVFKDDLLECLRDCTNREKSLMATSSMNTLINFKKQHEDDEVIVFDRFHATDLVYGAIERKELSFKTLECFASIEAMLESLGDKYLYVFVEPTDIEWSSKMHGKDLKPHEAAFEIVYSVINEKNKMKVNFNTLDEVITKIKDIRGGIR